MHPLLTLCTPCILAGASSLLGIGIFIWIWRTRLKAYIHKAPEAFTTKVGLAASCLFVVSLLLVCPGWGVKLKPNASISVHTTSNLEASISFGGKAEGFPPIKIAQVILLSIWTIVPPAWFLFEYTYIFPLTREEEPASAKIQLEHRKYVQDLAAKLWLALVSALLVLYFWKDLRPS
jgi:hypothetical protein